MSKLVSTNGIKMQFLGFSMTLSQHFQKNLIPYIIVLLHNFLYYVEEFCEKRLEYS